MSRYCKHEGAAETCNECYDAMKARAEALEVKLKKAKEEFERDYQACLDDRARIYHAGNEKVAALEAELESYRSGRIAPPANNSTRILTDQSALREKIAALEAERTEMVLRFQSLQSGMDIESLEKERDQLRERVRELEAENEKHRWRLVGAQVDPTIEALRAQVTGLREAMEKIGDYNTLDGEKYCSHESGWHGVAEFAREALEKFK